MTAPEKFAKREKKGQDPVSKGLSNLSWNNHWGGGKKKRLRNFSNDQRKGRKKGIRRLNKGRALRSF